ncbi:MAG: extracellular solute-binding protein [Elainellaceae cyanobacterium]
MRNMSFSRRSLLKGASLIVLGQLLGGCSRRNQSAMSVRFLADSVPSQLLDLFQNNLQQNVPLDFAPVSQLAEIYDLLQTWGTPAEQTRRRPLPLPLPNQPPRPPSPADLVTLGDYWLAPAIRQDLIQPLDLPEVSWNALPSKWQQLVRRDRQGFLSEQGEVWAAPYRWGSLVIAYRVDKFEDLGWAPANWDDLWRDEIQRKISLPDSPRAVIGLTLKKLGESLNAENLESIRDLDAELAALQQQVKLYTSNAYLQPLVLEDTWLAVGWSTDILPVVARNPKIAAVVPTSGTALTADMWVRPVRPASAESSNAPDAEPDEDTTNSLIAEWIDFCWQESVAIQISLLSSAASPVLTALDRTDLPNLLQDNSVLLPKSEQIERSEFLMPLPDDALDQYRQHWIKMRQTG